MNMPTTGVVFIHSTPAPLCPHLEWALGTALNSPRRIDWTPQEVESASYRGERDWQGAAGTASQVVSVLQRFPAIRFEVTENPTSQSEGWRFSYTPRLGLFHAQTTAAGDLVVSEHELRLARRRTAGDPARLDQALARLLGDDWDQELEPFRMAGEAEPIRWLRQVV
jgi:hypothetical protein